MSPPPLGPHNRSQTHLKLSGQLPLPALVSTDLHTTNSLKLSGTWTFLSLELSRHAEASRKGQTPLQNLILGLNRCFVCARALSAIMNRLVHISEFRLSTEGENQHFKTCLIILKLRENDY